MIYNPDKKEIIIDKELNNLDKFVIEFTNILKNHTAKYVIVSGFVSILLGRSRATEDVDLLIPTLEFNKFKAIWEDLYREGFECINTSKLDDAFDMLTESAIRFQKEQPIPNIEFKLAKNDLDNYSLNNRIKVILGNDTLYISPLELQITYKLFLGSDKDIEDARYLYKLFKENINKEELAIFIKKLKVQEKFLEIK